MATLTRTIPLSAPASEVWALVGAFGSLDAWHPWVPNCTLSDDGRTRTIDTGGILAIEVLEEERPLGHTYRVEQSPLPIRDYRARWDVVSRGAGCVVSIEAAYEPAGVPEAQAAAMLAGFFDSAAQVLTARFGA